jgi:hypothetical protein
LEGTWHMEVSAVAYRTTKSDTPSTEAAIYRASANQMAFSFAK